MGSALLGSLLRGESDSEWAGWTGPACQEGLEFVQNETGSCLGSTLESSLLVDRKGKGTEEEGGWEAMQVFR